jgi:hypothetical protein
MFRFTRVGEVAAIPCQQHVNPMHDCKGEVQRIAPWVVNRDEPVDVNLKRVLASLICRAGP